MNAGSTITADELFLLPDGNARRELVRGELVARAYAGAEAGLATASLSVMLGEYVRRERLGCVFGGGTGFVIARDPDTVRAADIAFVQQTRIMATGIPQGYFPGAPDLAVEVVSPTDRPSAVEAKVADWLAHGCQSVWVVDPRRRTVAVHRSREEALRLGEGDVLEEPLLLPGFQTVVGKIFP